MNELERIIQDEITAKGPITFARFVELALYHPEHGYYTSGRASIGRAGDFYTSPHTGPVFGRLVAETFLTLKQKIGGPCSLVEMGAGEGWLAKDFIEALNGLPDIGYVIVERSAAMREKQRQTLGPLAEAVRWYDSLEELPVGVSGVFFSNELVDALPFHRVRKEDDALKEVYVTFHNGCFHEATGTVSSPELPRYLNRLGVRLQRGQTTEIRLDACKWMRDVAARLSKGYVVTVDYGYPACDYFSAERSNGTMTCYRDHKSGNNPFHCIGEHDITAHVEFTSLCQEGKDFGLVPVLYTDQGSFLMDAAVRLEKRLRDAGAAQSALDELGMGLKPLVHPEWMGSAFKVLVQSKNTDASGLFEGVRNSLDRLCECRDNDSFMLS